MGDNHAQTVILINFEGIVAIAMTDTPNSKIRLPSKFNCQTCEACEKVQILKQIGIFRGVVTIATAITPKPQLRVCKEFNCELFEAKKKCAQIV